MRNYSDLLTEIQIIKDQIKLTEGELKYWYGIDREGGGIPLGGYGSYKFGANTSVIQGNKKQRALDKLNEKLKELEYAKVRQDILFEKLEGIDYKIAYHRIVDNMTHKEVAEELDFTEQYIRKRWMNLKSNKEATDTIANL